MCLTLFLFFPPYLRRRVIYILPDRCPASIVVDLLRSASFPRCVKSWNRYLTTLRPLFSKSWTLTPRITDLNSNLQTKRTSKPLTGNRSLSLSRVPNSKRSFLISTRFGRPCLAMCCRHREMWISRKWIVSAFWSVTWQLTGRRIRTL